MLLLSDVAETVKEPLLLPHVVLTIDVISTVKPDGTITLI